MIWGLKCFFAFYQHNYAELFATERQGGHRVYGVMDDTAEKTISTVSKAADEEFSMEFFKDAVR